jgi:hypothetical protein
MNKVYILIIILVSCIFFSSCLPELPKCTTEPLMNNDLPNIKWKSSSVYINTNKKSISITADSISFIKTGDLSHDIYISNDSINLTIKTTLSCSYGYENISGSLKMPNDSIYKISNRGNSFFNDITYKMDTHNEFVDSAMYAGPIEIIMHVKLNFEK